MLQKYILTIATFEQENLNQKFKPKTRDSVEKDFYKLLNNSNFSYDCRINIGNCYFEPLSDEREEISYLKILKYFRCRKSSFLNFDLINQEIENEFNQKLLKLKFDEYLNSRQNSLKIKRDQQKKTKKQLNLPKKYCR